MPPHMPPRRPAPPPRRPTHPAAPPSHPLQRKKRTHIPDAADPSKKGDPKSFVFRRGRHGAILKDLEKDLRKVMAPNTATALKESKRNVLKDFVHVAGPLGVTHFMILTASHNASYMRVAKTPRGPTLTMRIHEYALIRDVIASQQRPRAPQTMWLAPPLVVMNNFTSGGAGEEHLKLATSLFQNLFPAINVQTTKLSSCQVRGRMVGVGVWWWGESDCRAGAL